jgi:hypothetical protein
MATAEACLPHGLSQTLQLDEALDEEVTLHIHTAGGLTKGATTISMYVLYIPRLLAKLDMRDTEIFPY